MEHTHIHQCSDCPCHLDLVEKMRQKLPDETVLYDVAELFKVFGDSTRTRILYTLFDGERCVCEIAALLEMQQSAISHQLRLLKQARLIRARRDGKSIYYGLADDHVKTIFWQALSHVTEEPTSH